jgi:large subunit ribosomal protein L5
MNKMQEILIEKVTVNMGIGQTGEELDKGIEILELITNAKPVKTKAKIKQPGWGIREGLTIGAKVTLRKEKAKEFLEKALKAKEKKLSEKNFDRSGNFGFGIKEYIDLPGIKYDPTKGIRGFDVLVTLKKPGYRIKIRKIHKKKLPLKHRVTKEQAIEFMKKKFGVEIK